jgi:F-type H+-transporting ATPase subunit b
MLVGLTVAELRLGLVEFDWTFVFQIANTLILFLFLKKFLFKPVMEFMAAREKEIADSYKEAEDLNTEATDLKNQYLEKISKAEEEGRNIVRDAAKRAEVKAEEIAKEAEAEIVSSREKAKLEIEREKVKAINSLKDDIADIAVLAASKVIEKDVDVNIHKELIDKFIDEVGDAKWQS